MARCVLFVGDIGRMLDSVRIKTDYVAEKLPLLTFSDIQIICGVLKGSGMFSLLLACWSIPQTDRLMGAFFLDAATEAKPFFKRMCMS